MIKLQCFICKEAISGEDNELDPCSVEIYSNVDKEALDQRSQTFFCHFKCFKKINNDDSTMYLDSIETLGEIIEEEKVINDWINNFADLIETNPKGQKFCQRLFLYPRGEWIPLRTILDSNSELSKELTSIEEELSDTMLILWAEDFFHTQRLLNKIMRVVTIAVGGYYEHSVSRIICLEKNLILLD